MRRGATIALLAMAALGGCGGSGSSSHTTTTGAAIRRATPPTPTPTTAAKARVHKAVHHAPAPAAKAIGIGDQGTTVFSSPLFRALHIGKARLVVPWDVMSDPSQQQLTDAWLKGARAAGVEPFVSFSASRRRPATLPTVAQFKAAFLAFHRRWPQVRVYAAWNEINHKSQPTAHDPARAAAFYDVVRENCAGCTVVAADVLDQAGFATYLARFRAAVRGPTPQLWGLHNYSDTNRFRTSGTLSMLRSVPGDIWVTETGGVAKFGRDFPMDLQRQARATAFTFKLLNLSPRIRRLYVYNWAGAPPGARFDSGLTNPNGTPRPAYRVLQRELLR